MVTLREVALLAEHAYSTHATQGRWKRLRVTERKWRSFHASLWSCAEAGTAVLSVRGTARLSDCLMDLRLLCGREPRSWRHGLPVVAEAGRALGHGTRLILTGHSLGGAYASALGAETGLTTVTFNAPGMLHALQRGSHSHAAASQWSHSNPGLLNICLSADWIRQLSGPGLGTELHLGPPPKTSSSATGPVEVARALARGTRDSGGLVGFVRRSIRRHQIPELLKLDCARAGDKPLWDRPLDEVLEDAAQEGECRFGPRAQRAVGRPDLDCQLPLCEQRT